MIRQYQAEFGCRLIVVMDQIFPDGISQMVWRLYAKYISIAVPSIYEGAYASQMLSLPGGRAGS